MRPYRTLTRDERIAMAEKALAEGRVIQRRWRDDDEQGRELVCALAAFGPDINTEYLFCPADLMPNWLAESVPGLDDGLAAKEVPHFMRGLIDRARQWHRLNDAAWGRIRVKYRRCAATINNIPRGLEVNTLQKVNRLFEIIDTELNALPAEREPA